MVFIDFLYLEKIKELFNAALDINRFQTQVLIKFSETTCRTLMEKMMY